MLKDSQKEAYDLMLEFIHNPSVNNPFFTLSGAAGTGKSWITQTLVKEELAAKDVIVTAPTNKAKKVISARIPYVDSSTIHSLLGLKVKYDLKTGKEKLHKEKDHKFNDYKYIFIDETSMVDKDLNAYVKEATYESNAKIVYIGDKFQLPPIGEHESETLERIDAELYEVIRQAEDNSILDLVTKVRENINEQNIPLNRVSNYNKDKRQGYIYAKTQEHFNRSIINLSEESKGKGPDAFKVIAWRNKTVEEYNQLIRNHLYGKGAEEFIKDEWLIMNQPAEKTSLFRSDDVQIVRAKKVTIENINIWELLVVDDSSDKHTLNVVARESQKEFWEKLRSIADKKKWPEYYKIKEEFDFVNYSYAITAHKSQGSTYESVFVDDNDIYCNRFSLLERNKMLYTAYSRASDRLMILNSMG